MDREHRPPGLRPVDLREHCEFLQPLRGTNPQTNAIGITPRPATAPPPRPRASAARGPAHAGGSLIGIARPKNICSNVGRSHRGEPLGVFPNRTRRRGADHGLRRPCLIAAKRSTAGRTACRKAARREAVPTGWRRDAVKQVSVTVYCTGGPRRPTGRRRKPLSSRGRTGTRGRRPRSRQRRQCGRGLPDRRQKIGGVGVLGREVRPGDPAAVTHAIPSFSGSSHAGQRVLRKSATYT